MYKNDEPNITSIKGYESFVKIEPINKGWIKKKVYEKKYYIETTSKQRLLLRIADMSEYDRKKTQITMMECMSDLEIFMSRPVDFGMCGDGKSIYQLLTWVDGEDAESILPIIPEMEQYHFGLKSGRLLNKIHSIPAPKGTENWGISFNRMLQKELETYHSMPKLHCDDGDMITAFLKENRDMVGVRSLSLLHGDYNPANIIIMPNNEVGTIDLNLSYGDPYWDIFTSGWKPNLFPYFYSGQIRGYFDNEPTIEFWNTYSYYFAFGALIALQGPAWAGFNNPEEGKSVMHNILAWSDNFNNPVPAWYVGNISR
jgi:serine/threonine-protein kinase